MLFLQIPKQVDIEIFESHIIIKGPLGLKKKKKSKALELVFDQISRKLWLLNTEKVERHFFLAILNKLIWGVFKGFSKKLNIVGVGYKAHLEENVLVLKLGFSHLIRYTIPTEIKIKVLTQRQLTLLILGNDFQKINQVAAEIRALKPVEPYKGKGIKYFNEIVKKKEGKKSNV